MEIQACRNDCVSIRESLAVCLIHVPLCVSLDIFRFRWHFMSEDWCPSHEIHFEVSLIQFCIHWDNNIAILMIFSCVSGCQNDTFQGSQRRKFHQKGWNFRFSVWRKSAGAACVHALFDHISPNRWFFNITLKYKFIWLKLPIYWL